MIKRIIKFISSWTYLIISLLLLYSSYAYFLSHEKPYEAWLSFLFHNPAGVILYAGLIMNLTCINIRIISSRIRRNEKTGADNIKDMDSYLVIPSPKDASPERACDWLKNKGFSPVISTNSIEAVKGRYSFLPGAVLRLGLTIFLASLLLSAHLRQAEDAVFKEGGKKMISGREALLSSVKAPELSEFLLIEGEDSFRLKDVYAELIVSGNKHTADSGFPVRIDDNYYRITHLGFSQMIDLKTEMIQFKKELELDVLPPPKKDAVDTGQNIVLTFELQPENIIKKGLLEAKKFNLINPTYYLTVSKSADENNIPEESLELLIKPLDKKKSGNYEIELGEKALFIKIQSVRDPALLWIYAGAFLSVSGLLFMLSRFFWYEKRISIIVRNEEAHIGYSEEFYKKWGVYKFNLWKDDIDGLFSESSINKG